MQFRYMQTGSGRVFRGYPIFCVNRFSLWHPFFEENRELVHCDSPIGHRHRPFPHVIFQGHVEQLQRRPIRREGSPILRDLPQNIIQGLHGIRGIDDFAELRGIGEERRA